MNTLSLHAVIERVRAEFLEMPGLHLTREQIQRLCGVEAATCGLVLETLVRAGFLCRKPNGTYARIADGEIPHPVPAKADIGARRQASKAS